MGFNYSITDSNVVVLKDKMSEIDKSIREDSQRSIAAGYGSDVDESLDIPLLKQLVENNLWHLEMPDENGDIPLLTPFNATKNDDHCDFLRVIACGVKEGSFVQVRNDDGNIYRHVFKNAKRETIYPSWD